MGASKPSSKCPIKTAKKILKKHESSSIKLKALTKSVIEKIGNDDLEKESVRQLIMDSDVFVVDGKNVSLTNGTKRELNGDAEDADSSSASDKQDKKKAKKEKKSKTSDDSVSQSTTLSTEEWRKKNKIALKGKTEKETSDFEKLYIPYRTFDDKNCQETILPPFLTHCRSVKKFTAPTPIQAQCWAALSTQSDNTHCDVVGIAETGSGKTLAFSLPLLSAMQRQSASLKFGRAPRMLVLAPTRELAMQSHEVLEEFGGLVGLKAIVLYGGVSKGPQIGQLKKGADIVVATPGRLKDLVDFGACDLGSVSYLVLDEADRMLDMGFEEDVRLIISYCKVKEERQTAMFSATWPACIQKLAAEFTRDPVIRVYVGFDTIIDPDQNNGDTMGDSLSANKRVAQTVEVIDDRARPARLKALLEQYHKHRDNRILIFALYKKEADWLENDLKRNGWTCSSIHGNKGQLARTQALADFKAGTCPLLVATDVAARGLDIPNVEVVLNYTFPLTIEDYVHRIGRTGRAGKTGVSHTFFQPGDKSHAGALQQVLRQAGQDVPEELMKFGSTIKKKEHKLYGNFGPKTGPMKKATKIKFDF